MNRDLCFANEEKYMNDGSSGQMVTQIVSINKRDNQ